MLRSLQAILIYSSRWLWKNWENEELQVFNEDFNIGFVSKEAEFHKMKKSLDYQIRQTLAIPSIMAAYS